MYARETTLDQRAARGSREIKLTRSTVLLSPGREAKLTACLLGNLALSKPDETLQGELRDAFGRWRRALVELQTLNGRDGASAVLAAEAAIVQLEGSLVLARGLGDATIMDRALASLPALLGFASKASSS